MSSAVQTRGLAKRYGPFEAVSGVDLDIGQREQLVGQEAADRAGDSGDQGTS